VWGQRAVWDAGGVWGWMAALSEDRPPLSDYQPRGRKAARAVRAKSSTVNAVSVAGSVHLRAMRTMRREAVMLKLIKVATITRGHAHTQWCVDVRHTPEAADVLANFGTYCLPLPLNGAVSAEEALEFAAQTAMGLEHGVSL
jgi:hypothetical protein